MVVSIMIPNLFAWDHPGQMTTAAVVFEVIEHERPDLIDMLGMVLLKHPDPGSFWFMSGDARGKERSGSVACSSRPPAGLTTPIGPSRTGPTWHSVRWAMVEESTPAKVKAAIAARGDRPSGRAPEALALNAATLFNPDAKPDERALALSWVFPLSATSSSCCMSATATRQAIRMEMPRGTFGYVEDPLADTSIPLHLLW